MAFPVVPDPKTVALAVTPLIILGLIQPLDSMGVVLSQTLLGAGAVKTVMVWSVALQWGLFLPAAGVFCLVLDGTLETLWMLFAGWRILFAGAMVWCTRMGGWKSARSRRLLHSPFRLPSGNKRFVKSGLPPDLLPHR